jgi:hypothetical protein
VVEVVLVAVAAAVTKVEAEEALVVVAAAVTQDVAVATRILTITLRRNGRNCLSKTVTRSEKSATREENREVLSETYLN